MKNTESMSSIPSLQLALFRKKRQVYNTMQSNLISAVCG